MRYFQKDRWPVTSSRNSMWRLAHGRQVMLGTTGHIMAIVNVTPDSFSDGGRFDDVDRAVAHALSCVADGAAILDIGGESTRPRATPVSAAEEQDRVLPVIERLRSETDALISIDTYRAETARLAVEAGAHIINDVWGLRYGPEMAGVVAQTGAGVCIMYTARGRDDHHPDIVADEMAFLTLSLDAAKVAGVAEEAIVLDPGFGFVASQANDIDLMARLGELNGLGFPLLIGTSRKRFVGAIAGRDVASERDFGTAATTAMLRLAGGSIFRVHNVAGNRDALRMADAVLESRRRLLGKEEA